MVGRKLQFTAILASLFVLFFCKPYFVWNIYLNSYIRLIILGLMSILFGLNCDIKTKQRFFLFVAFFALLSVMPLTQGANIVGFAASVIVCTIPFLRKEFAISIYKSFLTIYSILVGLSAIVWILTFFDVVPILGDIQPVDISKDYNYTVYPLLVRANEITEYFRFCGPFDEAGVIGTLGALILTVGKYNLRDWRLLIVFITGLFSFSFFFYGISFFYFIVYAIFVSKNKKNVLLIFAILAVAIVFSMSNETMNDLIWQRLEWDADEGTFAGDNRLNTASKNYYESMVGTSAFYFGLSQSEYDYLTEIVGGSYSIFLTILRYGLFFVIGYILIFVYYGWQYKTNIILYLLFLAVFFGTLYQRPSLFSPEYLFLFSLMAVTSGNNLLEKNEIKQKRQYSNKHLINYANRNNN